MKPLFLLLLLLSACTVTITRKPHQRTEISPEIEQRVQQYIDSSRVIAIKGGDIENVYTIAIKKNAGKAKQLIGKK
jgi:hypothetical protein